MGLIGEAGGQVRGAHRVASPGGENAPEIEPDGVVLRQVSKSGS